MSIIHRSHGGANERNPRDHAGPAPADHALDGFEERLLAELKVVVAQQASTATHPQARRRARRPRPARPLLLTGAAPAASAAGPAGRRRRAGLLAGGLGLTAAGVAAVIVLASVDPSPTRHHGPSAAQQYLLAAAATAAATPKQSGTYWYVRTTMVSRLGKYTEQTWTQPDGQTWARGPNPYSSLPNGWGKGPREFPLAGPDWMFTQGLLVSPGPLPAGWRAKLAHGYLIIGSANYGLFVAISPREKAALDHGAGFVTYGQLQHLPAAPIRLVDWLLRYQRNFTLQTGLPEPEPATVIQSLAELVAGEPAPPQVRAAAFRAVAALSNVTSLGPGRGGQALRISLGGDQHATLIVDPTTSQARESITVSIGAQVVSSASISAQWVNQRP